MRTQREKLKAAIRGLRKFEADNSIKPVRRSRFRTPDGSRGIIGQASDRRTYGIVYTAPGM